MSSRHKRSSILKKRPSVDPGSLEASPSEATITTKATKRIGFKPKKSVKEFFASDETATIWCNSYELSADVTPPCLVINDDTTLKNASEMGVCLPKPMERGQGNKENLSAVEDRRNSCSESSIWDLSISAHEDEKRRVKLENSINSSVLNMTERLVQEPIPQSRQVLRQKQEGPFEASSAMDISPAKVDGKMNSPKKILYHHPKQKMFVSIDVKNEKQLTQHLDDSEINFFGPQESQAVTKITGASKILFQTSNTPNERRNKSIQTEQRPSTVDLRSTLVNADLSANWNSHVAASEPFSQHLTFGNSQFEISEAWNSHPAAALRLKMFQQGLKSADFDSRLSDDGGGECTEDVDTTLAITQTVAKMLAPGSRPVSLDNTRLAEPENMDITKRRESHGGEAEMETSAHMDVAEDASVSDVLIPVNGLSRARPSFVPSATPMAHSESECNSPKEVESISGQRHKADQRATILEVVPIESLELNPGALPPDLPVKRQTMLLEDKIVEDDPFLTVPQVEVKTPPRSTMRHTVYESGMDQSPAERGARNGITTPMVIMEPVKIDFPELIFGDNSFGIELTKNSETLQQETNRPKIHRIPSRRFKFGFNTVDTTKVEKQQTPISIDRASIAVDSPDSKPITEPSRKTVNAVADISLDINMLNVSNKSAKDPRRTEFHSQDVSMESPVSEKPSPKRSTVFTNDNINESHQSSLGEAPQCPRATILFNEKLNQTRLEPRSGSLEDLRNYGQSRRTVQRIEAMDCVSSDSPSVVQPNNTRRTELLVGDMDQSVLCVEDAQPNPRLTAVAIDNMDVIASHSPLAAEVHFENKNQRETISFNADMDQSSCTRKSSSLEPPSNKQKSRQTIIGRESMDQTLIDGRAVTVQEFQQPSQRTSIFCGANMDETCVATLSESRHILPEVQKSRLTSHREAAMDETCKSIPAMLEQTGHQTPGLSSFVAEHMNQESCIEQQSRRTVFKEVDMDETATNKCDDITEGTIRQSPTPKNNVNHSEALISFPKSRHTSCTLVNIDETLSPARKLEATLLERSKIGEQLSMQKSRNTVHQEAAMDETRSGTPLQPTRESIVRKPPLVYETIDLTTSPQQSMSHTLPNKSRLAVLADRAMDQTIPLEEPSQPVKIPLPPRYTTYKQDSMEETVAASSAAVDNIPQPFQALNELKLRRTVSCEMDMDQTIGARVLTVEMDDSGGDEDGVDVEEVTTRLDDRRFEFDGTGNNGIIVPDMTSMDVSVIKFSSVPPESTHSSRRTIIQPVNIAEDPVKCELKIEQSQSILNAESPTYTIKQEQADKSGFSFVVPQLPDDCVLRCAAQVPVYRSNQTLKMPPQLSQPECLADSITESSFYSRKISPMADLSEITEMVDLTYGSGRRPVVPTGDVSIVLKEVVEPPMFQPAVPVSVIQETPKKASMIPVRKSRGSIFDRLSMDLDESGIVPIVPQEQAAGCESAGDRDLKMADVVKNDHPCPLEPAEVKVLVKNEHVIESSDDEFFDAVPGSASFDEPDEDIVCVTHEAMTRSDAKGRGGLKFTEINDLEQSLMLHNQTTVGCKSLKFIDVNDLEQMTLLNQKRQLSRISKSVLLEQDPLNVSLTDDYPMKKRKTKIPTPVSHTKIQQPERTTRRVTFHQDLVNSGGDETNKGPEVETVIIKDEFASIIDDEPDEGSKFGQTLLTDPSVFIIEESDLLANESNISLVKSPSSEKIIPGSTFKLDNTYFHDYVNLTLHIDQVENTSCIVISDDSVTVPTGSKTQDLKSEPLEERLTLEDLPGRISKTRESVVFNSTVASEVMYELKQQVSQAGKGCCSFEGNCNCRNRRTMAAVKRDNVETVREMWNQNFDRILESVSEVPKQDVPLDTRICEVLSRPMKPLPLPCLEKQKPHLPETPPIWFLCENYMRSLQISNTPNKVYNLCDLPATPSVTALISNKLETEGYRWFLDVSDELNMHLYLRHRILRSIRFKLQLQKTKRWYSKEEDVRIVWMECVENRNDLVRSARLLVAHLEFVRAMDKITVDHLCSRNPTTAYMMRLIEQLDSIIEPIFSKVDQLYRIVRNNGAILEQLGNDDQLVIHKFYEYQHNGVIHWNRISLQFNAMDRIDHHSVLFHRKMINAECLFPTEHQCGRVGIQGLIFLECFLWNVEKISTG
ncbi:uncharacterized protein LOC135698363 [Ochlerotatus camptorhynchus]|uniref:uncharacterized protein LOC135698363 n=1 Tax=Ochlerotatus camptorhynchus TaxID=644619 RepID=UPI0031DC6A3C